MYVYVCIYLYVYIASRTAFDAAVSAAHWEEWELCQVSKYVCICL